MTKGGKCWFSSFSGSLILPTFDYSNLHDLVPKKLGEDQPNVIPDSSVAVNSKSDLDNSLILYKVMLIVLLFSQFL